MFDSPLKALEADCTKPSVLAMRGFRFATDPDGAKPKPKDPTKPDPADDEDELDDDEKLSPAAKAKIAKANREAKGLRDRLKAFEDAEAERKNAEMSDLEKAQEANKELQSKLDAALGRVDRLEIAIEKKLTVKQANRLSGATREELEADADDFLADLGGGEQDKKPLPTKQPREALRGGGDPTANEDPEPTADEAADTILKNL